MKTVFVIPVTVPELKKDRKRKRIKRVTKQKKINLMQTVYTPLLFVSQTYINIHV